MDNGFMGNYMSIVGSLADTYITQKNAQKFMEYQNDYNDPSSQVARLHGAGLTPWSVNANGNTSAQPVLGQSNISGAISSAQQNRIAERQVDVQQDLASAQKLKEESQAKVNDTLARTNEILLRYLPESEKQRIRSMQTGSDYTEKQIGRYDEQVTQSLYLQKSQEFQNYVNSAKVLTDIKRIETLLPVEVRKMESDMSLNRANVAYLKTQCDLNDKQIARITEEIVRIRAEADKSGSDAFIKGQLVKFLKDLGVAVGSSQYQNIEDYMYQQIKQKPNGVKKSVRLHRGKS